MKTKDSLIARMQNSVVCMFLFIVLTVLCSLPYAYLLLIETKPFVRWGAGIGIVLHIAIFFLFFLTFFARYPFIQKIKERYTKKHEEVLK